SCFAEVCVIGRRRLPDPPARTSAFMMLNYNGAADRASSPRRRRREMGGIVASPWVSRARPGRTSGLSARPRARLTGDPAAALSHTGHTEHKQHQDRAEDRAEDADRVELMRCQPVVLDQVPDESADE